MPPQLPTGSLLHRVRDRLERAVDYEEQEMFVQSSGFWARAITWSLIGGTAFGIGWLALAKTEEIVVAPGKLEPIGSVQDVQMPLQGVASAVLVEEGEQVRKGQVLVRLDTEASLERQKRLQEGLALKQRELALKQQELERSRQSTATRLRVLRESLDLNEEVLKRLQSLGEQGAAAELQVLEQRNKVQELNGEIQQTSVDQLRQQSVLEQQIQALRGEISNLRAELTESSVRLRYQEIVSPVDGVVFDLKPSGPGYVAQTSEPIMQIVPYDELKARVEIESSDIGFVSVGRNADISIDSFPATDFGVLEGTVTRIGSDALPPEPNQNKPTYRFPADITLKSQQLKVKDGKTLPLQVGMSLTANIKLRKVTYLQLLFSRFSEKADSLRQI